MVSQQLPGSLQTMFHFFYVVDNINVSGTNMNSDLSKINAWVNQWKMTFNLDPNKQTQQVIFSPKIRYHSLTEL